MKKGVVVLILVLILSLNFIISESPKKINENVVENLKQNDSVSVIIKFNNATEKEKSNFVNKTFKGKIIHDLNDTVSAKVSQDDLIKLESSDIVLSVIPDGVKKIFLQDSVPLINATSVWNVQLNQINLTGAGQTVCVLDTGTDFNHPDLQNKNLTCVIDCVGKSCVENCSVGDDHGHGTHVSGIIAANGTLKGVAPDANLISIKVCNSAGICSDSDVLAGLDWCIVNKNSYNISVISMSLGSGQYTGYCDAIPPEDSFASPINNAVSKNISVVVATGNTDETHTNATAGISSPACIQNATRVTATDKSDSFASFAFRYQFFTDILTAPGVNINSTYLSNSYTSRSGTSMATPHVSGAITLINQYEKLESNKNLTPSEISSSLFNFGKTIPDSLTNTNFSRIDIYSSILSLDQTPPEVNLISPLNSSLEPLNYTFSCNATDTLQLSNLTLQIWNSTELYYSNTTNATTNTLTIEENVSIIQGEYIWNCLAYDAKGNNAITSNSTIATSMVVNLSSPANPTSTNQNQTFVCDVSSYNNLSNVTFYLWNSSSELIYNESKEISGILNTTEFYYNFTEEGNFTWNCLATDSSSSLFSDSNFSIIYDLTVPNINLISPTEGYSTTSTSIDFSYNVTETTIKNCSLIINNQTIKFNQSGITNSTNSITNTLSAGTYVWKINCIDKAGNQNNSSERSITINSPTIINSGGGSSSGGGTPTISTIKINENSLEAGTTQKISKDQKANLTLGNQTYVLSISFITNSEIIFTVGDSANNLLSTNQTRKIDLNNDKFYDLEITLINITSSKAEIKLKKIFEQIPTKNIFKNSNETTAENPPEQKVSLFGKFISFLKKFFERIFTLIYSSI